MSHTTHYELYPQMDALREGDRIGRPHLARSTAERAAQIEANERGQPVRLVERTKWGYGSSEVFEPQGDE